jgi:hypothetical protein
MAWRGGSPRGKRAGEPPCWSFTGTASNGVTAGALLRPQRHGFKIRYPAPGFDVINEAGGGAPGRA